MKVLHVLANSPPDVNGYAVRTHKILTSQTNDLIALTSPWYPDRDSMVEDYEVDDVQYSRTIHPARKSRNKFSHKLVKLFTRTNFEQTNQTKDENTVKKAFPLRVFDFFYYGIFKIGRAIRHFFRIGWKVIEEKILIKYFMKRIIEVAKQENAILIHAHTPYRVGLPALRAARKLGLPFVYEMRGMWEETAVANGRWLRNGPAYRRFQAYETKVLRKADAVVCISETLKQEAIGRGVEPTKISVVTNAVDKTIGDNTTESSLYQQSIDSLNRASTTTVIGYIGSLREMEGVDQTAEAVANLNNNGHDVRLFVLTGQSGQQELRNYCAKLGLSDNAVICGPVPHEEVAAFYDLIDIFVVSRPDSRVTRLVTPLKPFEAMAMGRAVIASRLPALQEIITERETGLLYDADDVNSLTEKITELIDDNELLQRLGDNAREWVMSNRTWEVVVQNYQSAYDKARESIR